MREPVLGHSVKDQVLSTCLGWSHDEGYNYGQKLPSPLLSWSLEPVGGRQSSNNHTATEMRVLQVEMQAWRSLE